MPKITVTLPATGRQHVKELGAYTDRTQAEAVARAMRSHGANVSIEATKR